MSHKMPDRVPVFPNIYSMVPVKFANKTFWDVFYHKNYPLYKAFADTARYFKMDATFQAGLTALPNPNDQREFVTKVIRHDNEFIVTRTTCKTPEGELWSETSYPFGAPPIGTRGYIKTVKDFELYLKYFFPKNNTKYSTEYIDEVRTYMKNDCAIMASIGVPGLHGLVEIFDGNLEGVSYMYYDYPEMFETIRDKQLENFLGYLEQALECKKFDGVHIGASGLLTLQSPPIYEHLSLDAIKQITKMCKEAGVISEMHNCGLQSYIVETCYNETDLDCINPLQPSPMGDCDLNEIKKKYGDKLCIKGNVGVTFPMLLGTPKDVETAVIECLNSAKEDGNYILATEEQIGRDTPHENIFKMVETCKIHGQY
jgi:uroporphyrinogen-III decarboxylase